MLNLHYYSMQHNWNATNNNDYFIDVTNLGLHNKDFTLVTQASILYCDRT